MGATVRFITQRANGRQAMRLVEVDKDAFVVGRGTDCELQLPDLRVALNHVRVVFVRPGVVAVEAEGVQMFEAGGRRVRRVELKLSSGKSIEIGPYKLTFQAQDAGEGAVDGVRIDVERAETPLTKVSAEESEAVFSLKGAGLSKRGPAWAMALLTLLVFLAFPLWIFAHKAPAVGAQALGMRTVETSATGAATSPAGAPTRLTQARVGAGRMWSPGELSTAHAFLARDCGSCHERALAAVKDETCLHCHKGLQAHADPGLMASSMPRPSFGEAHLRAISAQFGKPLGRCAACHVEHLGPQAIIVRAQTLCADCHAKLDRSLGSKANVADAGDFFSFHPQFRPTVVATPGRPDPVLTRQWSVAQLDAGRRMREALLPRFDPTRCDGFSIGRANFRGGVHLSDRPDTPPAALIGDNPGLVFPHALHMSAKGCVATLARQLGVATDGEGRLGCANCHTPDASGKGFVPVVMERNCQVCHSLVFDTFQGVDRKLPHGQPLLVIANMLDFYKAQAVNLARPSSEAERHLPGEAAADRTQALRQIAFTNANSRAAERVRAIFSPGGSCYGCHEIVKPASSSLIYDVKPVSVQQHFLPRAEFDHRAHMTAGMACEQCHAARTSRSARDVLTPGIETCRTCHAGEHAYAAVPSPCITCHKFHATDPTAPLMKAHALQVLGAPVKLSPSRVAMASPRTMGGVR